MECGAGEAPGCRKAVERGGEGAAERGGWGQVGRCGLGWVRLMPSVRSRSWLAWGAAWCCFRASSLVGAGASRFTMSLGLFLVLNVSLCSGTLWAYSVRLVRWLLRWGLWAQVGTMGAGYTDTAAI